MFDLSISNSSIQSVVEERYRYFVNSHQCVLVKGKYIVSLAKQNFGHYFSQCLCRSPLGTSLRPGYRDRERDLRDRERSSSHDRDDHFGRPGYDRPPYERIVPERYGHSTPPYGMFGALMYLRNLELYKMQIKCLIYE